MKNKKNIIYISLIIITSFFFSLSLYINHHFTSTNFEQLLYNLLNMTSDLKLDYMSHSIKIVLISYISLSVGIILPVIVSWLLKIELNFKIRNKIPFYPQQKKVQK